MYAKARYKDHEPPHPASFRFARGIIKAMEQVLGCQNSEVLAVLETVRLQVKFNTIKLVFKKVD